jgi:aryl-alcohol dehydrogenase-like predicted oxidoreductase
MKYNTLGKTGWKTSAVSMGCWGLGGQWGPVDEKQAIDTIHAALDAGVTLFDTADTYGMGVSERLVGKALKNRPDGIYVATKVGNWGRKIDDPPGFKSIYSVINCCHASLHRLGTDTIDLYQCHVGTPENPEIFVEAFEKLKEDGKIREYAISTNDLASLKALNVNGACVSCQINYSILARSAEKDILPYCLENNIGVLLRGPLSKGILSGKFCAKSTFFDQVRASWNEGLKRDEFLRNVEKADQLKQLVRDDRSLVDVALQFTLAHRAVTCPIPGMKTPDHARQNARAADGNLSAKDLALIDSICPPA